MSEDNIKYHPTTPHSKREELENLVRETISTALGDYGSPAKAIADLIESREKELREEVRKANRLLESVDSFLVMLMVHHDQKKPLDYMRERINNFLTQKTTDDGK